jgi:endoglucanase
MISNRSSLFGKDPTWIRICYLSVALLCVFLIPTLAVGQTFPLHTEGRYIVDVNGHRVRLNGVNWYGGESTDFVAVGLELQSLSEIVGQIKSLGFNVVRLPWSNQMYESNPVVGDYALAANTSMEGEHALTIFDAVVAALTDAGIMVILDNHNSNAEWCCSSSDGNTLWYNSSYPQSSWISDWEGMVNRYKSNQLVIGVDLRNEPRSTATWGGSSSTDWQAAAVLGGNAVLSQNLNLLVFVEGVNYALDLSGVASLPVTLNTPNRVVYEAHNYGFDYSGFTGYSGYESDIQSTIAYLVNGANPQPLWVGEFGTCNTASTCVSSTTSSNNGYWFQYLTEWLRNYSVDWTYWAINGTESTGSGRTYGAQETYGILNTSWDGSDFAPLTSSLQTLQTTGAGPANGTYRIVNLSSGLSVDVLGASTASGAAVDQYTWNGGTNQQWKISYLNNGMYEIVADNSGLCLDLTGQSLSDGAKLEQLTCNGGANQQFVISATADGHYTIVVSQSGLAVEDPGFSTSAGTVLDQWGMNEGTNQEWSFETP